MSAVAGALLVLVTLREMFHELFHPSGSGSLGPLIRRLLWRAFRRMARRDRTMLVLAGPLMLVSSVIAWTIMLATGWALIFWPYLPHGFRFSAPLVAAGQDGFLDALYLSFVTLATLGYGDISPLSLVPRLLAPLEAVMGFALLTAGISWILAIYPILARRRALAQRLASLDAAHNAGSSTLALEPAAASGVLRDLAASVAQARADLLQSSVSYYFDEDAASLSIPVWMPSLQRLAEAGSGNDQPPAVRHAALMLASAIGEYAGDLKRRFLRDSEPTTRAILEAYARDHCRTPA